MYRKKAQYKKRIWQTPFFITFAVCVFWGFCGCVVHFWSPVMAYINYEPKEGDVIFSVVALWEVNVNYRGSF